MMTDDACLDWLSFISLASTWPQPTKGPHDATLDGCHFATLQVAFTSTQNAAHSSVLACCICCCKPSR